MWKKEDVPNSSPSPTPFMETPQRSERPVVSGSPAERATIGRSITIRGDVTGDEDLLIQGRVHGSVDLKQHAVTVGVEGDVKASIVGRVVIVEGKVEGNINSDEQVILRSSARVQGDITAPRLVLEDGARFRGGVDMGETPDQTRATGNSSQGKRNGITTPALAESSADKGKTATAAAPEKEKGGVEPAEARA